MASLPHTLWHLYLDTLVNYKQGSWVAKTASTCRVLAFAIIVPFVLLTLLDVASYVIARTLGVIDETKASTGGEHLQQKDAPSIVVHRDGDGDADTALAASTPLPPDSPDDSDPDGLPGNLKLAGVGTFSPAPSQPASPTLQRRELLAGGAHAHAHLSPLSPLDDAATGLYTSPGRRGARARAHDGRTGGAAAGEAPAERGAEATDGEGRERQGQGQGARRAARGSAASTSGSSESSFALVDRDSGSGSDDAGVLLRRRTRRTGTGPAADAAADTDAHAYAQEDSGAAAYH